MGALLYIGLLLLEAVAPSRIGGEVVSRGVAYAAGDTARTPPYHLLAASTLWIEGATQVNRFACETGEATGGGWARPHPLYHPAQQVRLEAVLAVPVVSFDCGNARMNRDLAAALRAEVYPQIQFRMTGAALAGDAQGGWRSVEAWGVLVLGGQERPVRLRGEAMRAGPLLRVRGEYPLLMSDFGIEPPSGPLGLIRARDRVLIRFDLHLAPYAPRAPGF